MKLLWLTPVHPASAIARYSELVVRRLIGKGCDVVIGATEANFMPSRRRSFFDLPIRSLSEHVAAGLLEACDAIIVNFGDHYPNHAHSLDVLGFPRVVGIFHDADMTNFGNGMRADGRAFPLISDAFLHTREVVPAIARLCAGAVAHSAYYRSRVAYCDGPIEVIPLAWSLSIMAAQRLSVREQASEGRFRVVTFGVINRNKCADRVIEALAASPRLRAAAEYKLLGAIEPEERRRLSELAESRGVRIVIAGPVPEIELHSELEQADVVSCLREPVLEGASASAIEAMLHGRAVLVSNAGFYADLPSECVARVPPATDVASIREALERLIADPAERTNMGRQARTYAAKTFSPESYADALLQLIDQMFVTSAYDALIGRLACQLTHLGVTAGSASTDLLLSSLEAMAPVARRSDVGEDETRRALACVHETAPSAGGAP